jgi:mono/diheme cytochrome c family protein
MSRFLIYFFSFWALCVVTVVSIAGFRGSTSRKPPIEIFPDMDRQPKLRPQTVSRFAGFQDGLSSRLPVVGTVARGMDPDQIDFLTGRNAGGSFVDAMPVSVSKEFVVRGRERYAIYCTPCHGAAGDGKGVTTRFGMAAVANLHDDRFIQMTDGEIFNTITHGKGLMGGYGDKMKPEDRWAVVAFVRALQISRLGRQEDIPAEVKAGL